MENKNGTQNINTLTTAIFTSINKIYIIAKAGEEFYNKDLGINTSANKEREEKLRRFRDIRIATEIVKDALYDLNLKIYDVEHKFKTTIEKLSTGE